MGLVTRISINWTCGTWYVAVDALDEAQEELLPTERLEFNDLAALLYFLAKKVAGMAHPPWRKP